MKKILVIGESCQDIFVYCNASRLCPDIPVPVLNEKYRTDNPGMAANVHRNIHALGVTSDIITNDNWGVITKKRYVHEESNHMFFRADSVDEIERIDLSVISYDYDLIVISDYDKGFLTEADIKIICSNHNNVFIDSKKILGTWVHDARYIKINHTEYQRSKSYIDKTMFEKIIRTEGPRGCVYREVVYPVNKAEVKDVSGAGDSFLAALVVKFLENSDIIESIKFANKCASEIVTKRGVSTIQCNVY